MRNFSCRAALTVLLLSAVFVKASAKSIVLTLNDEAQTKVYYRITSEAIPRMVIQDDGTFTMNGAKYAFSDILSFYMSTTDYNGAEGTTDGIVTLDDRHGISMSGTIRVYTTDGKLLKEGTQPIKLPKGIFILTNGATTFKIQKK